MAKPLNEGAGALLPALRSAVLDGPGVLSAETRRAAAAAALTTPVLADYVDRVRHRAHRTTDANIDELRSAGLGDDEIFELTIATALGAALHRLERGLAAIDSAEDPE